MHRKRVRSKRFKNIDELLQITLGTALMGCALSTFLIPFKLAPGGVSGIASVLYYLTGIRVSTLLMLMNVPIFILGFLHFDGKFLLRSIYGTIAVSVSVELFSSFVAPAADIFSACVFGGIILGTGIALVLKSGGTTGGTDILVMISRKFFPNLSVGNLFMIIDGVIILVAGATLGGWEIVLYSAAALFISTHITDGILEGASFARMVYIMSGHSDTITERIYKEMDRGVTGLTSVSMYTGKDRKILLCVIKKYELPYLKKLVYDTDPGAFVVISEAKEVMGNGFESESIF